MRSALAHLILRADRLYALLDAARDARVLELVREHPDDATSLFEDETARALSEVAPYLVQLRQDHPRRVHLLDTLLDEGWGRAWGIYLTSRAPVAHLVAHCRDLLHARMDDGMRLYFRFYDPRVVRAFLLACTREETAQFLGPIAELLAEGRFDEPPALFVPDPSAGDFTAGLTAGSPPHEVQLRPAHLAALGRAAEQTFVDRATRHLQDRFPAEATRLGARGMRGVVERGLDRARAASLRSERAVVGYLELCLRHGAALDDRDQAVRAILDDGGLTEDDKLEQLEAAAQESPAAEAL